jgi:RNA polymerase sigma factor (sigma-70 family)
MRGGLNEVLGRLRQALRPPDGCELTDGQLLARFIVGREEDAFAALVRRHGPMVLAVCRRLLGHAQDAEDAFQAAFLVLARKAGSVGRREAVAGFLYGVAYRTALRARVRAARRRATERQVEDMPHPAVAPAEAQDWRPLLARELGLLPPPYRAAVVLCDLEGKTRKEAARQLGWSEGTLSSRLARARRLLARRLARLGVTLPAGAVALALADGAAAALTTRLVLTTTRAAALVAAGKSAGVTTPAVALMKEVLEAMLLTKLKLALVAAVVALGAAGAGGLAYRAAAQAPGPERPRSELDVLRRENDLLKLNLEVVLEKVRAQGDELKALKAQVAVRQHETAATSALLLSQFQAMERLRLTRASDSTVLLGGLKVKQPPDAAKEAEDALKAYRQATDREAKRRAADALAKALARLKEQLK